MIRKLLAAAAVLAIGTAVFSQPAQRAAAQGMDVQPGISGYAFTLMDTQGNTHNLADYTADGKIVVLEWFNPGCPFVQKYYEGGNESMHDAKAFAEEHGVVWLTINSGAPGKQGHGIDTNRDIAKKWGIANPLLLDEEGTAGRLFGAANTPQLFILGRDGTLLYNGGVDEAKMAGEVPQHNYVINALTQYMAGEKVDPATTEHVGCNVKYGAPAADSAAEPQTAQGAR